MRRTALPSETQPRRERKPIDTSAITIRDMRPEESDMLYRLALKSFSPIEALGASKPKNAVIAMLDGEIVGAVFVKYFAGRAGEKAGYLDLGFVVPEHRGRGIGGILYPAATEWLKAHGCGEVCAMVKDDNVASWGLLQRNGFYQLGFLDFVRAFGFGPGLIIWLRTIYCIACGMNFWATFEAPPKGSASEMAVFIGLNLGLLACRQGLLMLRGTPFRWHELLAGLFMLCFIILIGYLGTLPSKRPWRFEMTRGGLAISALLMATGTFFTMLGRWYPQAYGKAAEMKKPLGIQALTGWVAALLLYLLSTTLGARVPFWQSVSSYASIFLIFQVLAFYPFEYYGGKRVFAWSPVLFGVLAAASAAVLFFV